VTSVGIGVYLGSRADELLPVLEFAPQQVLLVGLLVFVGVFGNALEFWLLYRALGAEIGLRENLLMFGAGQLLNHVPGQVGTLYRFQYLRTVHRLSYARAASGYGANLVLTVLTASSISLIAVFTIGLGAPTWPLGLTIVFLGLFLTSILTLRIPLPGTRGSGSLARAWERFRLGWSDLASDPSTAIWVVTIEAARLVILAARMQISLSWIGIEQAFPFYVALAGVTAVVSAVALTPAALGVRELAIGITAVALGVEFDSALLGATLDRAVALVLVIVVGGIGLIHTSRRLTSARRQHRIGPDLDANPPDT
jgi:uncharacterized membrane protein YbhN (UPF0104 family)